jgi:RNA polymerase sigma-70 factor (ECF subfamily)
MNQAFEFRGLPNNNSTRQSLFLKLRRDGAEREIAWSEFFDIYSPIICAYARRRGATTEMADDVVQEVMRRFFQAIPTFVYTPDKGRFRGYLKTCTSRVLSELRKRQCHEVEQTGEVEDASDEADLWNREWQKRRLAMALERVRRQYSRRVDSLKTFKAFEFCAFYQRQPSEVALELGMSIDSVHAAKSRVLVSLRRAVNELIELLD